MLAGDEIWRSLTALRAGRVPICALASPLALDLTANVLLAAGASLTLSPAAAKALCIQGDGPADFLRAAEVATGQGKAWVLDPQEADASSQLLKFRPSLVRGNGAIILALGGGKAVASDTPSLEALDAARRLAKRSGAIIAVTGAVDYVTDGTRLAAVTNGHPLMARVAALGGALSALMAAFLVAADDPFQAAIEALGYYGVAGELAAQSAGGPGTFRAHFLDRLHNLTRADLIEKLRAE